MRVSRRWWSWLPPLLMLALALSPVIPPATEVGAAREKTVQVFARDPKQLEEGTGVNRQITFEVQLSKTRNKKNTSVDYTIEPGTATPGVDYLPTSGTLFFNNGKENVKNVNVTVLGDNIPEDNETLYLVLSNAKFVVISDNRGQGVIVDDDGGGGGTGGGGVGISFDPSSIQVNEAAGQACATVRLAGPSGQTVTVSFNTVNGQGNGGAVSGQDFTNQTGTLTFAPGDTQEQICINITNDQLDELNELFTIALSNAVNGFITGGPVEVTILDDDAGSALSISDLTVQECAPGQNQGTVTAIVNVNLAPPSGLPVSVQFNTTGGTATSGVDFQPVSGQINFAPGQTQQQITLQVNCDNLQENDETFTITLLNPQNATIADATGVVTIDDQQGAPSITISDVQINEGDGGLQQAIFTVTLSGGSVNQVVVPFTVTGGGVPNTDAATAGVDFQPAPGGSQVVFAPGQTTQTITVNVIGDTLDENNEGFQVTLQPQGGATCTPDCVGNGVIVDDDGAPTVSIQDISVTEPLNGTDVRTLNVCLSNAAGQNVTVVLNIDPGSTANTQPPNQDVSTNPGVVNNVITLTIPAGQLCGQIQLTINADALDELIETLILNIQSATTAGGQALLVTDAQGTVTISDAANDTAPQIIVDLAPGPTAAEPNTPATIRVRLSAPSGQEATVTLATTSGTATAGQDFAPVVTTLTFAPGTTEQTFTVPTLNDTIFEGPENYLVTVIGFTNATCSGVGADCQELVVIADDETAPVINLSGPTQVNEGNIGAQALVYTVSLTSASDEPITVTVTVAESGGANSAQGGSDVSVFSQDVTFNPGETTKTVTVFVFGDTVDEGPDNLANAETFTVTVTENSPIASCGTCTVTTSIIDDDAAPNATINDIAVGEGNLNFTNVTLTVTLANPSEQSVTFNVASAPSGADPADGPAACGGGAPGDPTDFNNGPATVTFAPGQTTATVTVQVCGDPVVEGNETFTVTLTPGANAGLGDTAIVTILDDEAAPVVSVNDVSVNESAGVATFTVSISAVSDQPITVDYAVVVGGPTPATGSASCANVGTDFQTETGTVTIPAGQLTNTAATPLDVTICNDALDEPNETFVVNITLPGVQNAVLGDAQGIGTIVDDDAAPTASINDATCAEGAACAFTITLSAPSGQAVQINYFTQDGSAHAGLDYTAEGGTITIPAGTTVFPFSVNTINDTRDEDDTENFNVVLGSAVNASIIVGNGAIGTGTITDNDATPVASIGLDQTVPEGGPGTNTPVNLTVTLTNPSDFPITVHLDCVEGTASDLAAIPDYICDDTDIVFAPGETTKTLTGFATIIGDAIVEGDEFFTVQITNTINATFGPPGATPPGAAAGDNIAVIVIDE